MKIRYTPIDEVEELIKERRADEELQAKLIELTSGIEPGLGYDLETEPSILFAEYVARPTVRDVLYAFAAKEAGLLPVWATYAADTFTTTNKKKVSMLRPKFATPNKQSITKQWIVDTEIRQKDRSGIGNMPVKFSSINTVSEYWENLRGLILPKYGLAEVSESVVDLSEAYCLWAERAKVSGRSLANGYYPAIMGMYAARSALYSDFSPYREFEERVAGPAYEYVLERLGVEPIIVKPQDREVPPAFDGSDRIIGLDQVDITDFSQEYIAALLDSGLTPKELK